MTEPLRAISISQLLGAKFHEPFPQLPREGMEKRLEALGHIRWDGERDCWIIVATGKPYEAP